MNTCINPKLLRLTLEKMVIGLEEPILVKGIGELISKIDSGNGGYNVIHGEDFILQGDILNFKTRNKDGEERRVSKKVKNTIKINIGGGHIQERPVVELDIKFGGSDYKKIPFSVCDRSGNEHQVLISKDFVGNELEALIDVNKNNISSDNINVKYVNEGFVDMMNTIAHGTEGMRNTANIASNIRKGMWGEGGSPVQTAASKEQKKQQAQKEKNQAKRKEQLEQKYIPIKKNIANLKKQQEEDRELIKRHISKSPINEIVEDKLNCSSQGTNINVYKILDYAGGTCGSKKADPEFEKRFKTALNYYSKADENEEIVAEAVSKQRNNFNDPLGDDITPAQTNSNLDKLSAKELEMIMDDVYKRNYSIFYLIAFKKDSNDRELALDGNIINGLTNDIERWALRISQTKNWSYNTFLPFANDIGSKIESNAKGFFVLVSGTPGARRAEFYSREPALFGTNIGNIEQSIIDEYIKLNELYKQLGGEGTITEEGIESLIQKVNNQQGQLAIKNELANEYSQLNAIYTQLGGEGNLTAEGLNNLFANNI